MVGGKGEMKIKEANRLAKEMSGPLVYARADANGLCSIVFRDETARTTNNIVVTSQSWRDTIIKLKKLVDQHTPIRMP